MASGRAPSGARPGLGPDAVGEALDLALQALDLRGVFRLPEGIAVGLQRRVVATRLMIGVTEVLDDGGIFARELRGPLQVLDRGHGVAALEVHPPEAVDVEAVVRLELQRAADQ